MLTRSPLSGTERGRLLAEALTGAWRPSPPELSFPAATLDSLAPLLAQTGAAGLGWWRLARTGVRCRAASVLRREYLRGTAEAAEHEEHLQQLVPALRGGGAEPLVVKGWAVARLYPEPGLRPYDDIDLCVAPEHLPAAMKVLNALGSSCGPVDLHAELPDLDDRPWTELLRRSRLLPLGVVEVRVLGAEDQLRHLCLHFWRHVGFRPLWLCDVAAALEAWPDGFDWDYCLGGKRRLTDWVLWVLGLACRLLGAETDHPQVRQRAADLPRWLESAVLWRWGSGPVLRPLRDYLCRPAALPQALLYQWLNPIRATIRSQLPACRSVVGVQVLGLLTRPVEAVVRLRRGLTRWRRDPAHPFALHRQSSF